jgi:hypothetical protein
MTHVEGACASRFYPRGEPLSTAVAVAATVGGWEVSCRCGREPRPPRDTRPRTPERRKGLKSQIFTQVCDSTGWSRDNARRQLA